MTILAGASNLDLSNPKKINRESCNSHSLFLFLFSPPVQSFGEIAKARARASSRRDARLLFFFVLFLSLFFFLPNLYAIVDNVRKVADVVVFLSLESRPEAILWRGNFLSERAARTCVLFDNREITNHKSFRHFNRSYKFKNL